jgi:hypothetical protein
VLAAFEDQGFVLGATIADDDWRTLLVRRPEGDTVTATG